MGGLRHIRTARTARIARPVALVTATATLLAALFVCLGAGRADAPTDHAEARPGTPALTAAPSAYRHSQYSCPYDRDDCGLFPHLTPAVLTAPPPDTPVDGVGPVSWLAPEPSPGQVRRTGALPRAPDLHVLQVLRT
ncbi:hypothetical protein [Streptomyces sp. NPDC000410]|uniref:hypothetical protein n=1 Tax=Streptomyces sp. NPDC000410 TaxID=3154254 RepID=UPI00332AD584